MSRKEACRIATQWVALGVVFVVVGVLLGLSSVETGGLFNLFASLFVSLLALVYGTYLVMNGVWVVVEAATAEARENTPSTTRPDQDNTANIN